ncbi:winged helix DNA-binding domain-containing protein [Lichtheimia hyalospora FSU 10163]|nr:winged helix DNA-binding domain-containing protein [Lichtheimia hyalospora FSU 10163]
MSNIDYLDVGGESDYGTRRSSSFSSSGSSAEYIPPSVGRNTPVTAPRYGGGSKSKNKSNASSFITKLYSLVNDTRHQDLVSWNPTGTSFLICNVKRFAQQVLPEYFKHGNFSSFVRLLNMYGFHKINKSPRGQRGNENEIWEFSHPQFQQQRPDLLKEIRRKAMDSEVLRRETGDMHMFFSMLQVSQADLQRQFQALQTSFSNLLQGFEETRKMQMQQQFLLKQLADRQGVSVDDLVPGMASTTPDVFITAPVASSNSGSSQLQTGYNNSNPQPNKDDLWNEPDHWEHHQPSYGQSPTNNTTSPDMILSMAANTPLPPSPSPNVDPNNLMFASSPSPMMS